MAAGDFSNSALKNIQIEINSMFMGGGVTNNLFDTEITSARAVLENQTFMSIPILDRAGKCLTVEGFYWKATDSALDYNSSSADSGLANCELPTGHEGESAYTSYAANKFMHITRAIDDNLCGNAYDFATISARELNYAMALLRDGINKACITHMTSNNMAAPSAGSTGYTVDGNGVIEVPSVDWSADIVAKLYEIALVNQISNIRILSGTNLFRQIFDAGFNALNDSQRDEMAKFNFMNQIYNDLRTLDTAVGTSETFLFDPNVIGFVDFAPLQRGIGYTPTEIVSSTGKKWIFLMDDPILKYRRTTPQGSQVVPVTYVVEYQQVCSDRDSLSLPTTEHRYLVQFVGGLWQSPSVNSQTGIIQLTKTAGI